jgi:hypothetical protein
MEAGGAASRPALHRKWSQSGTPFAPMQEEATAAPGLLAESAGNCEAVEICFDTAGKVVRGARGRSSSSRRSLSLAP